MLCINSHGVGARVRSYVHLAPIYRINSDLTAFYVRTHATDRCEINMKSLGAEKLDQFPVLSGAGIKGATVRNLHR